MGRSSQQVVQSDVTAWGVAALVCGAVAVLAANIGGLLPGTLVSTLHATRTQGGNISQLRAEIVQTQAAAEAVASATRTLQTRFDLIDRSTTELMRRVIAVEQSVPLLVETLPAASDIDRSLITASIGSPADLLEDVDGGTMALNRVPLFPETSVADLPSQPLPALAESFAIVLGTGEDREWAEARWDALLAQMGPLLLGLEPRLVDTDIGVTLLAGPFAAEGGAQTVCARLADVGSDCTLGLFEGEPLLAGR